MTRTHRHLALAILAIAPFASIACDEQAALPDGGDAGAVLFDGSANPLDSGFEEGDGGIPDGGADGGDVTISDAGSFDGGGGADAGSEDAGVDVGDGGADGGLILPDRPTLPAFSDGPAPADTCESAPEVGSRQSIPLPRNGQDHCGPLDREGLGFHRVTLAPGEAMTYRGNLRIREGCSEECLPPATGRGGYTNLGDSPRTVILTSSVPTDWSVSFATAVVHRGPAVVSGECADAVVLEDGDIRYAQTAPRDDVRACGRRHLVHYAVDVPAGGTLVAFVENETGGDILCASIRTSCGDEDCTAESSSAGGSWSRVTYTTAEAQRLYIAVHPCAFNFNFAYWRIAVEIIGP